MKIRAFVTPPPGLSRAMDRVALALARFAPEGMEIVTNIHDADIQVLHVVGRDAVDYESKAPHTAVIQYCTWGLGREVWAPLWERAESVWSYYALDVRETAFYHAPMGLDPIFCGTPPFPAPERDFAIMTSGYVAGGCGEAIEEALYAADRLGLKGFHLGPVPEGMTRAFPARASLALGIPDTVLAKQYRKCKWVSGLRFGEGFEIPVIEGLASGCRPIVFDRPEMRQWFDGHAVFVKEQHGEELECNLAEIMSSEPEPVSRAERRAVIEKFDWKHLAGGFWDVTLGGAD